MCLRRLADIRLEQGATVSLDGSKRDSQQSDGIGGQCPADTPFNGGLTDRLASLFQIFNLAGLPDHMLVEPHIVHHMSNLVGEPLQHPGFFCGESWATITLQRQYSNLLFSGPQVGLKPR